MEFVCKHCGLLKSQHIDVEKIIGEEVNEATLMRLGKVVLDHEMMYGKPCLKFTPDNLKYLENKYEARNR